MTSRGAEKMKDDTIGVDASKDHLAKNRGKVLAAPLLKRHNAQRLEQIKRQITAIEAAILEQVQADPDLAQRFAILATIPGVSAITAFALLIEMPELGALEPGHLHASPGRDPIQSGHEDQIHATDQCREARQGRPHRRHAKADPPGKRSPQGQQALDPKTRLIKTDTLASVDGSACDGAALQHISFVEVLLAL